MRPARCNMNRIILLVICIFILSACRKKDGVLKGHITYYSEEDSAEKADSGAAVYAINTDSFPKYKFDIIAAQILNEQYKNRYDTGRQHLLFDSIKLRDLDSDLKHAKLSRLNYEERKNAILNSLKTDSLDMNTQKLKLTESSVFDDKAYWRSDSLATVAQGELQYNNSSYKVNADGNGDYVLQLPPAKYDVLVLSAHRKGEDFLDARGKMQLKIQTIVSEKESELNHKFEIF